METEIYSEIFGFLQQDHESPYYFSSALQFSATETIQFTLNLEQTNKDLNAVSKADLQVILNQALPIYVSLQNQENMVRQRLAAHHLSLDYDWWKAPYCPMDIVGFVESMTLTGICINIGNNIEYPAFLDYKVECEIRSCYLFGAVDAQMKVTDTEFKM